MTERQLELLRDFVSDWEMFKRSQFSELFGVNFEEAAGVPYVCHEPTLDELQLWTHRAGKPVDETLLTELARMRVERELESHERE